MKTILDEIVARRREDVAARKRTIRLPDVRTDAGYAAALADRPGGGLRPLFRKPQGGPTNSPDMPARKGTEDVHQKKQQTGIIIAECKKASPSKGVMLPEYDPVALALRYQAGGASAVSVLTEPEFFSGSDEDLRMVRRSTGLPVLRKDFMVDEWQIDESFALGADIVLLIASVLDVAELAGMIGRAHRLGMEVLLEARDGDELDTIRLSGLQPDAIGVNSRDLRDFSVDPERLVKLTGAMPSGSVRVAESGIHATDTVRMLFRAGFDAFLIGEHFALAADPEAEVRRFREVLDGEIQDGQGAGRE